jgi:Inner membrane protein YgaP-like, transmembrane domain
VTTQNANKPNWFAAGWLGQFMASTAGRLTRIVAGVVLIGGGLLAIGGIVGIIIAAIGLVPLLAGAFDVCVFSALFGGPLAGSAIRALGGR